MIKEIKLQSQGVLTTIIPTEIMDTLITDIDRFYNSPNLVKKLQSTNHTLTGIIEEEYNFTPREDFIGFLNSFYNHYCDYFNIKYEEPFHKDVWLNFQKKNEYNPCHHHPYSLMSWVLWIKIPYNIKDEDLTPPSVKANGKSNGRFSFTFSELNGKINVKNIEEEFYKEGSIILFPSYLYHCVYPFYTTDELRISLAGNFIHGN